MAETLPATGDVLIAKRDADGLFEISIVPGNPQVSVRQKFEAVRHAHAFAAQTGSSVWFIEASGGYTKIDTPRAKES